MIMLSADFRLQRASRADIAYADLLQRIMDGRLRSGESLPLAQLARSLGVSQTPIRESLAKLEGQGLVARDRFLREALATQRIHVQHVRLFGDHRVTDQEVSVAEHRAIMEAIAVGDRSAAEAAMASHLRT